MVQERILKWVKVVAIYWMLNCNIDNWFGFCVKGSAHGNPNYPQKFDYTAVKTGEHPNNLPPGRYVTEPIENQMTYRCHDCWAMTAIAAMESHVMIKLRTGVPREGWLSKQDLVECCVDCGKLRPENRTCRNSTGFMAPALKYLKEKGVATKKDYPVAAAPGNCTETVDRKAKIENFKAITGSDDTEIIKSLLKFGPLAIGLNNSTYSNMLHGTTAKPCTKEGDNKVYHYVLMVGYNRRQFLFADPWFGEVKNLPRGVDHQFCSTHAIIYK